MFSYYYLLIVGAYIRLKFFAFCGPVHTSNYFCLRTLTLLISGRNAELGLGIPARVEVASIFLQRVLEAGYHHYLLRQHSQ